MNYHKLTMRLLVATCLLSIMTCFVSMAPRQAMAGVGKIEAVCLAVLSRLGITESDGTNAAVIGPSSSTDATVPVFSGTTGELLTTSTLSVPAAGTLLAPTALVVGAATTDGVRLEVNTGILGVREGDDSAECSLSANGGLYGNKSSNGATAVGHYMNGISFGSAATVAWNSGVLNSGLDTGLARSAAGVVKVTDGSSGSGKLLVADGTAAAPAITGADTDSGLAFPAANQVALSTNGVAALYLRTDSMVYGATQNGNPTTTWQWVSETVSTSSGASQATSGSLIPAGATVEAVVVRVLTTVQGATSFDIGDGSDVDRYGATIAVSANTTTTIASWTADPRWWTNAARGVTLTANGGNFSGGTVRVAVLYRSYSPPGS